jgi:fructosamine-3-kinase
MSRGTAGEAWRSELAAALGARAAAAEPVSGGDINDAYRVRLDDGRVVFVKTHAHPPPGMFEAEARGLDWLRAGLLRVPRVLAAGERFLALEWLALGGRGRGFEEALGRGLAELHGKGAPCFGLDRDGYLATLPQPRIELTDGPAFWIEHRVRPLAERARAAGRMPDVSARLDALLARRDRFGPPEPPARLHGDLWWGNVAAADGAPVLIDPAVYGAPRGRSGHARAVRRPARAARPRLRRDLPARPGVARAPAALAALPARGARRPVRRRLRRPGRPGARRAHLTSLILLSRPGDFTAVFLPVRLFL